MTQRPNIMLLQGEDVGLHIGCYPGNDYTITPNLDKLASQGARYDNAFSHSPVCAPSRGGMVTGCYPWSIGNMYMRSKLKNPPRNFTHELKDAGYHTTWATKMDFNFDPTDGWCDTQEPWWEKDAPDEPFFVYQNFDTTHESRMFGEIPSWHRVKELKLEESEKHDPDKAPLPAYLPDTPELRVQIAKYHDALTYIDQQIGKRLQWLEDNGKLENTIVIFLSDHGRGLPREKRWCYEAGVHMPLIIRWPGKIEPGTVVDDLTAWVDIAPTLLSIAGVEIPKHYQGQVFLGKDKAEPRDYVYFGRDRMDSVFDYVRGVRDKKFHYIRNYLPQLPYAQYQWYMEQQPIMPVMRDMHQEGKLSGDEAVFFQATKPEHELYDFEADPEMVNNLADNPEYFPVLERMQNELDNMIEVYGDYSQITEESHVEKGLIKDDLHTYDDRREQRSKPGQALAPEPPPMTLREAKDMFNLD